MAPPIATMPWMTAGAAGRPMAPQGFNAVPGAISPEESSGSYQPVLYRMAWAPSESEGMAGLARFVLGFADLSGVQAEARALETSVLTAPAEEAAGLAHRLEFLKKGLNLIDRLNDVTPAGSDAMELRRRTASDLIRFLKSPEATVKSLKPAESALGVLRREQTCGRLKESLRAQVRALYLDAEDPRLLFASELPAGGAGLDPFRNPSVAVLAETPFWKTFRRLSASGDLADRSAADAFRALIALLRSDVAGPADAASVDARIQAEETVMRSPALAAFFAAVSEDAANAAASGPREEAQAAVLLAGRVAEDAFRLETFADQRLTLLPGQGDVHDFLTAAAKAQLEEAGLQKKYFSEMGEEKGADAMEKIEASLRASLNLLNAMDVEKIRDASWDSLVEILGKTGKALAQGAVRIIPFFLRSYSDHVAKTAGAGTKGALTALNARIRSVADQKGSEAKLKLGRELLAEIQSVALADFVDKRLAALTKMRGEYVDGVRTSGRLSYVGNPYAGLAAINGTPHPEDRIPEDAATYDALIASYRAVKERIAGGDAAGAANALRRLETSAVLRRLSTGREQAEFIRSLTTDAAVMAGSLLFSFGLVGGAVRLGLGSALARTSLSLGARSLAAELGGVAAGALPQTVIDRNVLKPEEAAGRSFGHAYAEQLAFMLLAMGGGAAGRGLAGRAAGLAGGEASAGAVMAGHFAGEFAGIEAFTFGKIYEAYGQAGHKDAARAAWEKFSSLDVQAKIAVSQAALVLQFHFVFGPAMKRFEEAALRPLEAKAYASDMAAFKGRPFASETESFAEAEALARRGLALAEAGYTKSPSERGERELKAAQVFVANLSAVRRQMEAGEALAKLVNGHVFDPKNEQALLRLIAKMPFVDPSSIHRGANGAIAFETRGFTFGAYSSEGGSFVFVPGTQAPSKAMRPVR